MEGERMEVYDDYMKYSIFENESLEFDGIDFTKWLTEDGELIEIEELADSQVMDAIYTLKRKLRMLPEHVNSDIWEEYSEVLANEAKLRQLSTDSNNSTRL